MYHRVSNFWLLSKSVNRTCGNGLKGREGWYGKAVYVPLNTSLRRVLPRIVHYQIVRSRKPMLYWVSHL